MIKEFNGDIIKALKMGEIDILAHGCNCQNRFGYGIAGQIAKQIPVAKKAYHKLYDQGKVKLGVVQYVKTEFGIVANCMTQYRYGNARKNGEVYLDYPALEKVLNYLYKKSKEGKKVGLPEIGCGLAGGDWDRVKEMIARIFHDQEVYVYHYPGGK